MESFFAIIITLVTWAIALGLTIYWVITLIDVAKSEFKEDSNKIVWLLVVLFLGPLGSVIYTIVGKKQKKPKEYV
ncbi:MAG: PLDc N-terminal domain-containing protein [Sulfurimonas sp.]